MTERYETFEAFWPYYVREHSKKLTRWMHFVGTSMALGCVTALVVTRKAKWLPLALVAGYGPAWASHFFVEHNRPATFTYPTWSLQADLKMFELMLQGRMDDEVARVLREYAEKEAAEAVSHSVASRASSMAN
ncbi:MAG: DUF962 domain-containing protein [Deltaproteobacteria bacterium]|nr:DUF962 domain-containing protein [Deltaproteobacteria bacterium]